MYKKVLCTCEVVVLLIKPIVFLTFSLSSASLDLKVPNVKSPVRSCILEETDEIVTNCKVGGQTITLIKTAADIHIDKDV